MIVESKQLPENRTVDQAHFREEDKSAGQLASLDSGLEPRLGATVDKELVPQGQQTEDSPVNILASILSAESLSFKETATPQAPRAKKSNGIRKAKAPASFDVSPIHQPTVERPSFALSMHSFDPSNSHKELPSVFFGEEATQGGQLALGIGAALVEEVVNGGQAAHVEEVVNGGQAAQVEEAASVEPFPPLVRQATAQQRGNSHQGRRNYRNRK